MKNIVPFRSAYFARATLIALLLSAVLLAGATTGCLSVPSSSSWWLVIPGGLPPALHASASPAARWLWKYHRRLARTLSRSFVLRS